MLKQVLNPKAEGLTKKEKEAVGLLSIGTFLEYFDLMLYIHLSVLLNDLFFPKTDPTTAKLLAASAFCLTYVLRPIGGFIIGRIGDIMGRKFTITLTTSIMALACIMMATASTYEEVGIRATIIVIICRALQGFSSLGEIMGAQIYITEILKNPWKAVSSGIVVFAACFGGTFALVITYLAISGVNWRIAFWIGSIIAFVGVFARARLRETIEFTDYKKRIKIKSNIHKKDIEKPNKKTLLAFAFTEIQNPICFYVTFIFCSEIMKTIFNLTAEQIIFHNLKVSIILDIGVFIVAILSKRIHPIKTAIVAAFIFTVALPFIPYWLNNISSLFLLGCIQVLSKSFSFSSSGTLDSIQYKYFPISKRFSCVATVSGLVFAFSSALVAFGLIPLTYYFGNHALWFFFIPAIIGYWWAINYFKKLEIKSGNYHYYPYKDEDVEFDIYPYNYELGEEYKPYQKECKYSKRLLDMLESINKTAKKEVNIKLVKKAIAFAKKWHDGQKRKTGEPYYTHPLAVAMMTAEYKFKTHMIVAAILHDVVEDSKCTVELIAKEFTPRIAEIVELLTREYKGKKLSIAETIKRIFCAEDYETLLIKGLDRVHNLQTIHGMKSKKQKEIAEETIYEIASVAAYAVDDLNINDKRKLERKLYKLSNKTLRRHKAQAIL